VRRQAVAHARFDRLQRPARTRDTDHVNESSVPLTTAANHGLQRWEDFLEGEIAGDAEKHQRV